jgi:Tol biopolymer transport system component
VGAFVAIEAIGSHHPGATPNVVRPSRGSGSAGASTPAPSSGEGSVGPIVLVEHGSIEEMDVNGTNVRTVVAAGPAPSPGSFVPPCCFDPAISPDGTKLAFVGQGGVLEVADTNGDHPRAVTGPSNGFVSRPTWSPSGDQLAFITVSCLDCDVQRQGQPAIDVITPDGSSLRQIVRSSTIARTGLAWSPNGAELAFATAPRGGAVPSGGIDVVPVSGGKPRPILGGIPGGVAGMSWAPGPVLLFSDLHEPGIFAMDGQGASRRLRDPDTASLPTWSADGVHFAAIDVRGRVVVATVVAGVQATIGPRGVSDIQWGGGAVPSSSSSPSVSA